MSYSELVYAVVNAKRDKVFECALEQEQGLYMDFVECVLNTVFNSFKFTSNGRYSRTVLFFNVVGTLFVFPVELAVVFARLWYYSDNPCDAYHC